jgi:hypothetical protein
MRGENESECYFLNVTTEKYSNKARKIILELWERAKQKDLKLPNSSFINKTLASYSNATSLGKNLNATFLENVSDSFEDFQKNINGGILLSLLVKICNVLILGFTFYPILLCVELKVKSFTNYFLSCLYIWCMLFYHVYNDFVCDLRKIGVFDFLKCFFQEKLEQNWVYQEFLNRTKLVSKENKWTTAIGEKSKINLEGMKVILNLYGF